MTARPVGGLREHAAHVNHGAAVLMLVVQSAVEDIEGAAEAGQWGMVLVQGRQAVLACLHVRGLEFGAGPYAYDETSAFDPLAGAPEEQIRAGLALIERARSVRADGFGAWFADLRAFAAAAEASLGLTEPVPNLRSPEGMFAAMRMVRGWTPVLEEQGLPPILPSEWTTGM